MVTDGADRFKFKHFVVSQVSRRNILRGISGLFLAHHAAQQVPTRASETADNASDTKISKGQFVRGPGWPIGSSSDRGPWVNRPRLWDELGRRLTDTLPAAAGEAVYFERGCLYRGPETGGQILLSWLRPPQIGRPTISKTSGLELPDLIQCHDGQVLLHPGAAGPVEQSHQTTLLRQIWRDKLALQLVRTRHLDRATIPLELFPAAERERGRGSDDQAVDDLASALAAHPADGVPLKNRSLYDVVFLHPGGQTDVVGPHAAYAQDSWQSFGIIHATDLHVCRRADAFRSVLQSLGRTESAKNYINFNNGLRDLIRYANFLHESGRVDLVVATGDLVDFVYEEGDARSGGGNFEYFVRLLRGEIPRPPGEPLLPRDVPDAELLVPIFVTVGNHDYRTDPYRLRFNLDIPGSDEEFHHYINMNLSETDAREIQGGEITVDQDAALTMVHVDKEPRSQPYSIFLNDWIAPTSTTAHNSVIELDQHRIVLLDTEWDAGIPSGTWEAFKAILQSHIPLLSIADQDVISFVDGHVNQEGFDIRGFNAFRSALQGAPADGVFIVGLHAPVFNPSGNRYPHHQRETERISDEPYFSATPDLESEFFDGLNEGYAKCDGQRSEFLRLCAGEGGSRPVDLILNGHIHRNVEFRVSTAPIAFRPTDFLRFSPRWTMAPIQLGGEPAVFLYRPDDGLRSVVRLSADRRIDELEEARGSFRRGWTVTPIQLGGQPHVFLYNPDDGLRTVVRIENDGRLRELEPAQGRYRRGWTVAPIQLNDQAHLLLYNPSDGLRTVVRVDQDGRLRELEPAQGSWRRSWTMTPLQMNGRPHVLLYNPDSGARTLIRIENDGRLRELEPAQGSWRSGWTITPLQVSGQPRLLLYNPSDGLRTLIRIETDGRLREVVSAQGTWSPRWTLTPLPGGNEVNVLLYRADDGKMTVVRATADDRLPEIAAARGAWDPGLTSIVPLPSGDQHHVLAYNADSGRGSLMRYWHNPGNQLLFFHDYYTQNPGEYHRSQEYYPTHYPAFGLESNAQPGQEIPVHVILDESVRRATRPTRRDNTDANAATWPRYWGVNVPINLATLSLSPNPKVWWQQHRPLFAQTASLGPTDTNERGAKNINPRKPGPAFQGFRLISISDNTIQSMTSITLDWLYSGPFRLP